VHILVKGCSLAKDQKSEFIITYCMPFRANIQCHKISHSNNVSDANPSPVKSTQARLLAKTEVVYVYDVLPHREELVMDKSKEN